MALTPVGIVIYDRQGWRLTSYGNGWAYVLRDTRSNRSVWMQDEDAGLFREEFDAAFAASDDEAKSDEIVASFFDQYSEVMTDDKAE